MTVLAKIFSVLLIWISTNTILMIRTSLIIKWDIPQIRQLTLCFKMEISTIKPHQPWVINILIKLISTTLKIYQIVTSLVLWIEVGKPQLLMFSTMAIPRPSLLSLFQMIKWSLSIIWCSLNSETQLKMFPIAKVSAILQP